MSQSIMVHKRMIWRNYLGHTAKTSKIAAIEESVGVSDSWWADVQPARCIIDNAKGTELRHPTLLIEWSAKGLTLGLALALQDAGWWLRSEVIWYKPNAHPESVMDRPTKAHETIFLLSKSQDYYYDVHAVKGPNGRRLRTLWDVSTEPRRKGYGIAHPAPMPMTIAEQCIRITSEPGDVVLDPYAGSGTTLVVAENMKRRWVGTELSPQYAKLAEYRLRDEC